MKVNAGTTSAKTSPSNRTIDTILQAETLLRNAKVTDTPRLEAEILLADLLRIERAKLIASYFEQLGDPERAEYFSRINRCVRAEPIAYITGKKEFMGFTFRVDHRVLIPRPETETLMERVLEMVRAAECKGGSILDIGTGCGGIAVSLALLLPHASIHATDISADAVDVARHNANSHRTGERVTFHVGSVYFGLPEALKSSFDLIVSNPPYVSDAEYLTLDRSIREFEPSIALKGGVDGLDLFRQIVAGAAKYLVQDGLLAVEIGENQAETATELLEFTKRFTVTEIVRDLTGRQRIIIGRKTK